MRIRGGFHRGVILLLLLTGILSSACQSGALLRPADIRSSESPADVVSRTALFLQTNWHVQLFENLSDTHAAAEAVDSLLETHLRKRGVTAQVDDPAKAMYRVSGVITRWHYEAGASERASVALTLNVQDALGAELLWSASGSKTGRRGNSMAAVADDLVAELVSRLPLVDDLPPQPLPTGLVATGSAATANSALVDETGMPAETLSPSRIPLLPGLRSAFTSPRSTLTTADARAFDGRSIAFFYASDLPLDELAQFDHLVLEPDNVTDSELQFLARREVISHAYLSVGEVGPTREYARQMLPEWMLGRNPDWDSQVLDLANPDLRRFLLDRAGQLHARGFGGLFLDTMDSFNLVADSEDARQEQQAGLVNLIRDISVRYPSLRIISNRGFEVLDQLAPYLDSVAAESLYARWNNAERQYDPVPEADRAWLLGKLEHARDALGLDVIAIDYLPASRRDEARTVARQIASHGFVPWVANPALDMIGIGALEVIPRKVLMLYDSEHHAPLAESPVHKFVAMPVEYHGYVPEYLDLAQKPLPTSELKGRYAGVVTWTNRRFANPEAAPWLQKQLDDTVPVLMMGMPPVELDERMSRSLGLAEVNALDMDSARVVHTDALIAPERTLAPRFDSIAHSALSSASENAVHMSLADDTGTQADVVVTGPFGGFAWQPGLVDDELDHETYWVLEPFGFIKRALQLSDAPMPDVTSENGKRLWLAHIDGDALPSWAEMPGGKLGAEVIFDEILERYQVPHSVSVVEAEMTEFPAYDDRRQRMYDIVRKTFRLDHVELASHTYSHPFKWKKLNEYRFPGRYNLDIDNYVYTPERDIAGSIDFVNHNLAPMGKTLEVFLWSGDALPGEAELAVLDRLGIPNMNGGLTYATDASPTMTLISPMARPVGEHVQVYAPIMNENMYTNDWLGPFDGFRHVNETFRLTGYPRRLKPMNVYYHFYSGTKLAAMKALREAYDYSLSQDIHPVFGSDYARKVPDYRNAGVARTLDGQWQFSGLGHVRSIRVLATDRWPMLADSNGLVGARRLHDGVYVHTDGSDRVRFALQSQAPGEVHLISSNGRIEHWQTGVNGLSLRIRAEVPVTVELGGAIRAGCLLRSADRVIRGRPGSQSSSGVSVVFSFSSKDTGHASLHCPA